MDFDVFLCKLKLRVCLFCFYCFQHTFIELKITKTFSEVKNVVFPLSKLQRCRQNFSSRMEWMRHIQVFAQRPARCFVCRNVLRSTPELLRRIENLKFLKTQIPVFREIETQPDLTSGARSILYILTLDSPFFLSTNSKIRDRRAPHVTWRQVWVCRPIAPYPGEIWVLSQGSFFLKVSKKCPQTGPKEGSKRVPERAPVKS